MHLTKSGILADGDDNQFSRCGFSVQKQWYAPSLPEKFDLRRVGTGNRGCLNPLPRTHDSHCNANLQKVSEDAINSAICFENQKNQQEVKTSRQSAVDAFACPTGDTQLQKCSRSTMKSLLQTMIERNIPTEECQGDNDDQHTNTQCLSKQNQAEAKGCTSTLLKQHCWASNVDDAKHYLQEFGSVLLQLPIYSDFLRQTKGIQTKTGSEMLGYDFVQLIGFNETTINHGEYTKTHKQLTISTTFGKDWGDEGIGNIDEEFFRQDREPEAAEDDIIMFLLLPDANGLGDRAEQEKYKTEQAERMIKRLQSGEGYAEKIKAMMKEKIIRGEWLGEEDRKTVNPALAPEA